MCDGCKALSSNGQKNGTPCSWLHDRTSWDAPCAQCVAKKMQCFTNSVPIGPPPEDAVYVPPKKWTADIQMRQGTAELRRNSPGRKQCLACRRDDAHCRALMTHMTDACNKCFQLGLDCVDHDQANAAGQAPYHPLFDLSRIGFGKFLPFQVCGRCLDNDRPCDKQRPCDACVIAGEADQCDPYNNRHQTFNGRVSPGPGPLYYLALGYGPAGVYDNKDGSRLCHWVGPPYPCYGLDPRRDDSNFETKTWSAIMLRRS